MKVLGFLLLFMSASVLATPQCANNALEYQGFKIYSSNNFARITKNVQNWFKKNRQEFVDDIETKVWGYYFC